MFLEIMIRLSCILIGGVYGLSWHQKHQPFSTYIGNCFMVLANPAISLIIKYQSPKKMSVVQRAISTVMYGNGANKQVSLLFLMLCLLLVTYAVV